MVIGSKDHHTVSFLLHRSRKSCDFWPSASVISNCKAKISKVLSTLHGWRDWFSEKHMDDRTEEGDAGFCSASTRTSAATFCFGNRRFGFPQFKLSKLELLWHFLFFETVPRPVPHDGFLSWRSKEQNNDCWLL
jgi:hypothetical protein